jgi:hypothetical protein
MPEITQRLLPETKIMPKTWWNNLSATEHPFPHIPESEILAAMPKSLHPKWRNFLFGQTVLALPNKEAGVYPWDLERFVRATQANRKPTQAKQTARSIKYCPDNPQEQAR